jgi:hypothetical protein
MSRMLVNKTLKHNPLILTIQDNSLICLPTYQQLKDIGGLHFVLKYLLGKAFGYFLIVATVLKLR